MQNINGFKFSSQLILGLFLCSSPFVLTACEKPGGGPPGAGAGAGAGMPPAMPVVVANLRKAHVKDSETFVGTLKALKSVVVRPRVEGYITRIFVQSGDRKARGSALFEIDTAKQRETLAGRMANSETLLDERKSASESLHSLLATRQARVASLHFQQGQYERYRGLKAEGAVSQESVDQYYTQLKSAEAELASIDAQIRGQESMVNRSSKMIKENTSLINQEKVQLGYHTVQAAFDGIIGDVPVRLGQYCETSTELTTLDQQRPLEVYVNVPSELAPKLKLGLPLELLDGKNTKIGQCAVTFISPEINTENQSVLVKGLYANEGDKLRSNQQVTCRVVWQIKEEMLVPTNSVVHISGQDFVFVARPGKDNAGFAAKQLPVTLGDIHDNAYVVKQGMQASDRVVVSDVQRLYEGLAIAPTDKQPGAQGNP